jgi:hypothetical protein
MNVKSASDVFYEILQGDSVKRILDTIAVQIIFNHLLLILVKFFRMRLTADLCNFHFVNNGKSNKNGWF